MPTAPRKRSHWPLGALALAAASCSTCFYVFVVPPRMSTVRHRLAAHREAFEGLLHAAANDKVHMGHRGFSCDLAPADCTQIRSWLDETRVDSVNLTQEGVTNFLLFHTPGLSISALYVLVEWIPDSVSKGRPKVDDFVGHHGSACTQLEGNWYYCVWN